MALTQRRDIRRCRWFEEVADHFGLDPTLLQTAVFGRRFEAGEKLREVREARRVLEERFMRPASVALLERVRTARPTEVSDEERSRSWQEYIFVCLNAERRAFERMPWYDRLIAGVVRPLVQSRGRIRVVDYGCGSSLLTRMIAQDLGERVETVSVDVGRYAVEFSVARNRLYSPAATGLVIEDVMAPLRLEHVDLILAYAVFEHLPNAPAQIQGLIDSLGEGGLLVENYSGHSSETPHKSDTWSAYRTRDENLDRLGLQLRLLYGKLPFRRDGVYGRDEGERYWIKGSASTPLAEAVRARLRQADSLLQRARRGVGRRLRAWSELGGRKIW